MLRVAFAVLTASFASFSWAEGIYDNGSPDGNNAHLSDFDPIPGYGQFADDFVLISGNETITGAHWWGIYFDNNSPTAPDDFTLRIYADQAGVPQTTPLYNISLGDVGRSDTGSDVVGGYDIYEYDASFSPIALSAGTTYWLSIINDTTADANDQWLWAQSSGSGNTHYRPTDNDNWNPYGVELAFQLTVVPEPSTLTLSFVGVVCLACWWVRRWRAVE